ncbi:hypothetical protein M408DRAFT_330249 [Serendipita vermifera MAFF 305830]|uniref:F-box domain-containing protein n=1 Tax=Serendipita vermifera MAFF 305830 TaxID=933852 RepID=A0A0C3ARG6_SERVB|nr:hypothetical protein M408DRAFT_330249 [Serendipita vermifera MAFF 305830]
MPKSVRTLTITGCQSFPASPLRCLTSLKLEYAEYYPVENDLDTVHMPALQQLKFTGHWVKFVSLDAPVLESLHLHLLSDGEGSSMTHIHPRKITIDDSISSKRLLQLLGGTWRNLEELHWICSPGCLNSLDPQMVQALAGNLDGVLFCPSMRILGVQTTVNPLNNRSGKKCTIISELGSILNGRRGFSSNSLLVAHFWCQGSGGASLVIRDGKLHII